jgi:hypothetical protein
MMAAAAGSSLLPTGTAGAAATSAARDRFVLSPASFPPPAKRARACSDDEDEEDVILDKVECPTQMEKADFQKLKELVERHRGDKFLHLLPMPSVAHGVLGLPAPKVSSLMDTALACLSKTSKEAYTSSEVEVRDLRLTHTEADFPTFYTGPSHPHMLPEGGIRVEAHGAPHSGSAGVGASAAGAAMVDE